jgi:acetyltransferase-like isoleucine patch superfamily enzyme
MKKEIKKLYYSSANKIIKFFILQFFLILVYLFNLLLNLLPFHFYKKIICGIFGVKLGSNVSLCNGVRFLSLGNCSIGDNSVINRDCLLDNRVHIEIGANVSLAVGVKIFTMVHDTDVNFGLSGSKVVISNHVCIYAGCMIMPGIVLKKGCVVYPGSVVTKSFGELSVIGGVPAVIIKKRSGSLEYQLNGNFWFN